MSAEDAARASLSAYLLGNDPCMPERVYLLLLSLASLVRSDATYSSERTSEAGMTKKATAIHERKSGWLWFAPQPYSKQNPHWDLELEPFR